MTSVICPTCGAACSLGGETTRYFIPPKDESERIVDLQRQLTAAKAEYVAANTALASTLVDFGNCCEELRKEKAKTLYYEETLCFPIARPTWLEGAAEAKEISPVKVQALLAEIEAKTNLVASKDRVLDQAQELIDSLRREIEAMRPVVEACKARYEHHNPWDSTIPCYCLTCQWYRDYLERKQP